MKDVLPSVVKVDLDILMEEELPAHFILDEVAVTARKAAVIGGKRIL